MPEQSYPGTELDLFAKALNWKRYLRHMLAGYLQGRVLEVGAGIGATTRVLRENHNEDWVCLEPDPELSARAHVPSGVVWKRGNLIDIPALELFDCILYMDVLEHIADDRLELGRARDHLNANGVIVVARPPIKVSIRRSMRASAIIAGTIRQPFVRRAPRASSSRLFDIWMRPAFWLQRVIESCFGKATHRFRK